MHLIHINIYIYIYIRMYVDRVLGYVEPLSLRA